MTPTKICINIEQRYHHLSKFDLNDDYVQLLHSIKFNL